MEYLIGADEAGYGPNLGPLVVSATVWQVTEGVRSDELYRRLKNVVVPAPNRVAGNPAARVAMADSKTLYQPGKGLRHLERGLWAAWATLDRWPRTWTDVWEALAHESIDNLRAIPWYDGYDEAAPIDANADELELLKTVLREEFAATGVRLLAVRSRPVFPEEFNALVEHHGSKGAALSHTTIGLVCRLMEPLEGAAVSVLCDKHGGRNRYAPLLSEHFPDSLIEIYSESRPQSVYRFGPPERRVEFRFQARGESHLPTALASMASKYLRELAMRALNAYWCRRVPGLRPTAGYPQDAKRFKAAIETVREESGIENRILWRTR